MEKRVLKFLIAGGLTALSILILRHFSEINEDPLLTALWCFMLLMCYLRISEYLLKLPMKAGHVSRYMSDEDRTLPVDLWRLRLLFLILYIGLVVFLHWLYLSYDMLEGT